MVRVARDVVADAAVNRPPGINAKEILAIALVNDLIRKIRSGVLNDPGSLRNWVLRK